MIEQLKSESIQKFIIEHQEDDPANLSLKADRFPDYPISLIARQIKSRQKAKHKLPLWYSNEKVIFPHGIPMEQCSSQLAAEIKSETIEGESLLDLTGGSGVDTYFLSRNFSNCDFVEQQTELCELASYNFSMLSDDRIQVHNMDNGDFIAGCETSYDWIYIDPARRGNVNNKLFKLSDCQPNIISLQSRLFELTNNILIKTSPMLDIHQAIKELKYVVKVMVVAIRNEVKEVLYFLQKEGTGPITIETINDLSRSKQLFNFALDTEANLVANFQLPSTYLFEPNSAIMKAGGFKELGIKFNLAQLHPNTHLFTAAILNTDFPGRQFKIMHTSKLDKKIIKQIIPGSKANVAARNFPISPNQIMKKLGLRPGGDIYIFAVTTIDEKKVILICEKVMDTISAQ